MQIKNLSEHAKEIPDIGDVEAGGTIEVPDEVGASLCEQVDAWAPAKSTKKES